MKSELTKMFSRAAAMLLVMLLTSMSAWAQEAITGLTYNTTGGYYEIPNAAALNALATYVNSGHNGSGKTFKLTDDIDFNDDATLKPTTTWNDATSTESNFTPIGNYDYPFYGNFDGDDKTIRGLRINSSQWRIGLFGMINGAEVKNVTLADARIAGSKYTGGIVGHSIQSTITNCHVCADVAIMASSNTYGGIVGENYEGTVSSCSSAVKIIVVSGTPSYLGGIAGSNVSSMDSRKATLTDNVVIGAVIPSAARNTHAAIAVDDNSGSGTNDKYHVSYAHNYYYLCTVANVDNATNVGIATYKTSTASVGDLNNNDNPEGAVYSTFYALTLASGITAKAIAAVVYDEKFYCKSGTTVTLSGQQSAPEPPAGSIYEGYTVNGTAISGNTFEMPAEDVTVNSNIIQCHTLTLADGITATATPTITVSGTPYYKPGTTVTLSYNGTLPTGCIHEGYIVTKDGTDPAETVEVTESNGVYSFTMPASNVTVTSNIIQCHTLTVADGITATSTPATTVGSTPYYSPGTTVTLSYNGTLPEGYGPVYTMTKDGTSDVVTTPGTFSMPASNVTISVTVTDLWGVSADPAADGSADHPYVITNVAGLDLLAQRVNGGEGYYGKYFMLMNDIAYPYATAWNAADSQENNFTRIGTGAKSFSGTFDGQGHAISGIRIYSSDEKQGLFGCINGGCVRNVILADARITGQHFVGGIAGTNSGTIENCHVTANVLIGATGNNPSSHGGIAGYNHGTVDGCTSSATLSQAQECGGIVGYNQSNKSVVKNCLAIGVTINGNEPVGAIVGSNEGGTLSHNYYSGCAVNGNTSGIGCGGGDIPENDGAVPAYALTLLNDDSAQPKNDKNANRLNAADKKKSIVTLSGRTLYRDGKWNTLCLPFDVTDGDTDSEHTDAVGGIDGISFTGTPLEGATVMCLNTTGGTGFNSETGVLTLNFTATKSIEAGKPYIVKWPSNYDIVNPIFGGVTINNSATTEVAFTGGKFVGSYSPVAFAANDKSILFLGAANTLYWPNAAMTLGACRAYFQLADGVSASKLNLNFDDETTGVTPFLSPEGEEGASPRGGLVGVWYTLSGTHLSAQPTKPGLYIHGGRKVVIK